MKHRHFMFAIIPSALAWFGLCPMMQAVVPAPDGGYPGGNTAEGQGALFSLSSGTYNTAVGLFSLRALTENNFNTAIGAGALFANTADNNTATGAGALLRNMIGDFNTANGAFALFNNTTGGSNTASGASALVSNTEGDNNTASGFNALHDNTIGFSNTANGRNALFANISGSDNTALGFETLGFNTIGSNNTAIGKNALENNTTGSGNIALGVDAGTNVLMASNVICIGTAGQDASNSCFIGQIFGATSSGGAAVLIGSNGKLGTTTSSRRFKEDIYPMAQASQALYALKPVTFRYKREIDPKRIPQFGLVAEEVEAIDPNLVIRDKEEKPYSVRYDQVNAMLLNEFLKEHRKVQQQALAIEEQKATIAELGSRVAKQDRTVEALALHVREQDAKIQRVSARFEVNRPVLHMATN